MHYGFCAKADSEQGVKCKECTDGHYAYWDISHCENSAFEDCSSMKMNCGIMGVFHLNCLPPMSNRYPVAMLHQASIPSMIWAEDTIHQFGCHVIVGHLFLIVPDPTTAACDIMISASLVYYFSTLRIGMEKCVCFRLVFCHCFWLVTIPGRGTFCSISSYSPSTRVYFYGKLSYHTFVIRS